MTQELMQSSKPFFSNDAEGWMKVLGFLITVVGASLISMLASLRKKWVSDNQLRTDLDGIGAKVNALTSTQAAQAAKVDQMSDTAKVEQLQRSFLEARVNSLETSVEGIQSLVREGVEAIKTEVAKVERAFTTENRELRERLVRLETAARIGRGESP